MIYVPNPHIPNLRFSQDKVDLLSRSLPHELRTPDVADLSQRIDTTLPGIEYPDTGTWDFRELLANRLACLSHSDLSYPLEVHGILLVSVIQELSAVINWSPGVAPKCISVSLNGARLIY